MAILYNVSICCMLLSIWGAVQLSITSLFMWLEAVSFIHDVHGHADAGYEYFIRETKANYKAVARNCIITAALYLVMIILCFLGIKKANRDEKKKNDLQKNVELVCVPRLPAPNPHKKKKEKD